MGAPRTPSTTGSPRGDRPGAGSGGPGGSAGGSGTGGRGRPPGSRRAGWLPPPERRRRGDLLAVAAIAVVVVVGVVLVLATGDGAGTDLRPAAAPLPEAVPGPPPTALVEAWRAPSPATLTPVVVGPAVVTAGPAPDGSGRVTGHDPVTGAAAWEYTRPEPVCTVGGGFGQVLGVFATDSPVGTYCSDVASLDAATGARGPARNADVRPGTRLLADATHVTATGRDYLETWRSDLVATLEYGALPTPVQSERQPRADCAHGSIAVASGLVAVLERCPGETSDRLTVLDADPSSADKPEDRFSVPTGVVGGRLVAATPDREAVAAPDGTLRLFDGAGAPAGVVPLGPLAGPTTDPPGLTAGLRVAGPVLLWWTGTGTVGLDPTDLRPRWTLPGALGPGSAVPVAGPSTATDTPAAAPSTVLVPVPGGIAVLDAVTGQVRSTVPVDRGSAPAPVGLAVVGTTVVEQRGSEVVALRPPG